MRVQLEVVKRCVTIWTGGIVPGQIVWVEEPAARHLMENGICRWPRSKIVVFEKPQFDSTGPRETPEIGPTEFKPAGPTEKKSLSGVLTVGRSTGLLSSSVPGLVRPSRV